MRSIVSSSRGSTLTDDRRSVISANSSNASTLIPESITSTKTGASQLRKFTAGVGRPGLAREAREAVRNVITTQNPTRVPPIAEPLDYEKFVTERSIQMENDPQRDLLMFPRDDIEESLINHEYSTVSCPISSDEVASATWLLTKEALAMYTEPSRMVTFNYSKFAGDYNKVMGGSCSDNSTLSSLVFESDMAQDEEKAAMEGYFLNDVVKEGYVMVVKSDPSLLDNLKSAKKRYCILKREEGGEICLEVRKSSNEAPKQPPLRVNSAQLKSTKKGKTVLIIEPCPDENEKSEQKALTLASENVDELSSWLLNINRAIAFANKGDTISSCSERLERTGRKISENAGDTESIASEDSLASRDSAVWRGRNSAARALQPPIVDRRNLFSLFYNLSPLPDPRGDSSCVLSRSRCMSPVARLSPTDTLGKSRALDQSCPAVRFLAEFKKLELKLSTGASVQQQIEPFYISVFIFDAQNGRRISEEFHIDASGADGISTDKESANVVINGVHKILLTHLAASQVLFTVPTPHKDLWILFRIDRLLSSDTTGDVYMKSSPDVKSVSKVQKQIHQTSARLSGLKQRFAWTARPLFPELRTGDVTSSKDRSILQLFRCEANRFSEADIQKNLVDFTKLEKAGKMTIPNSTLHVKIDFSAKASDFSFRVNPSFFPLRPWTGPSDSPLPPVFEVQSFEESATTPYSEFINLLYVYPLSLKYDSQKVFAKARNISCSVRFVRGDERSPSKCFFDRLANGGPFTSHASCAVQHHQQFPQIGDEMKLKLPTSLKTTDHLLFSFSHVSVAGQSNAKSPESAETPIGYAWLPLVWKKDRLVLESDEQEFALPVAVDLPTGYLRSKPLGFGKGDEAGDVKWVDQKALFRFRLRLVSSIFTTEAKLQSFFQACQRLESKDVTGDVSDLVNSSSRSKSPSPGVVSSSDDIMARSCSPLAGAASPSDDISTANHLISKTDCLCDIPIDRLIPFLPIVLGRLLNLLPRAPTDQLALSTISSIISICDRCSSSGRKKLLRSFVRLHFISNGDDDTTHSAICRYLPQLLKSAENNLEELTTIYRQLWFFLDVTAKSMAQLVVRNGLYKSSRRDRFSNDLLHSMNTMIEMIVPQIITKHREMPEESRSANTAIAYFLRCCLSIMDRGLVFKWIHFFVAKLDASDSKVLRDLKVELLTVLCQYEHWLPLCLPVLLDSKNQIQRIVYQSIQTENTTSVSGNGSGFLTRFFNQIFSSPSLSEANESDRYSCCADDWFLSQLYASRHFPIGLLFQELSACLREPRDYRRRPIALLRNLIAKHSYDKRYSDLNIQRRIAILYCPIIRFSMDIMHELQAATTESDIAAPTGIRAQNRLKSLDRRGTVTAESTRSPFSSSDQKITTPVTCNPLAEKLDGDEVQDILLCMLWVLHRLPKRILGAIWTETDGSKAVLLLRVLEISLEVFRYKGKDHAMEITSRQIRGKTKTMLLLPPSSSRASTVDYNGTLASDKGSNADESSAPLPFGVLQLLNLSQEAALVVLDALQTFSQQLAARRSKSFGNESDLFNRLLVMQLNMLDDDWPESVRLHAIAALALFVNLFKERIFAAGPLDSLSMVIERVLIQMASRLATVQNAASALLQLILRNGYETAQNIMTSQAMEFSLRSNQNKTESRAATATERLGRPGAQTGVALARLLGTKSVLSSSGRFERGLSALESLVLIDSKKTVFDRAVLELIKQLRGVMMATVALKDAANDPMRLADLHIQLADSYRGSAALRSAWFDTLAEAHFQDRWYAEAAVCHAHSVAIMANELKEKDDIEFDWEILNWISREIVDCEKTSDKERNVQPAGFTLDNLASKIEKTAQALTLAERYEAIGPLYRLLIPAYERKNKFNSLVGLYAELQQAYSRAAEIKTSGKRHLATYFRVRFYGKEHFDEMHDTEWVYREAGLTSLAEFSLRLKECWRVILAYDKVEIDPQYELDVAKLDPTKAYLQVTHVEPVLEKDQVPKDYCSHTNISKFYFETPIIEGELVGKEPPMQQQALKRVTLEVTGVFPSSRRRLPVVTFSSEIFSPLQFAFQKISSKADQIRSILSSRIEGRTLDIKGLQLLLQGAVMPTVNAGPLAYAEAFTNEEQKARYGEEGINKLKEAFRSLMSSCESALQANESAIGQDQTTYHEVLVASFDAMHERLQIFFAESLRTGPDNTPSVPKTALHILDSIGGVNA